jgi:hypothetical protein
MTDDDLIGAWRLLSYHDLDEATGALGEGPLGPHPRGILIYDPSGHMTVGMMRGPSDPGAPTARRTTPLTTYMGYAGTWRLDGATVVHGVEVSSHAHLVGTAQVRDAALDGHRLTLYGTAVMGERRQRRVLLWEREGLS